MAEGNIDHVVNHCRGAAPPPQGKLHGEGRYTGRRFHAPRMDSNSQRGKELNISDLLMEKTELRAKPSSLGGAKRHGAEALRSRTVLGLVAPP